MAYVSARFDIAERLFLTRMKSQKNGEYEMTMKRQMTVIVENEMKYTVN